MVRCCAVITCSAFAGVILAAVGAAVVLTFGPESLLHLGDAVYDDAGLYLGVR
jgi:hypothetical protein